MTEIYARNAALAFFESAQDVSPMALDRSGFSNCLIVGAGPGGLAPLFAAAYDGRLQELLNGGVTIVEQGSTVGAGDLGRYAIDLQDSK